MYANALGENGRKIWGTSYQCCIMRKVIRKEVAARRFVFFLDSALRCYQLLGVP